MLLTLYDKRSNQKMEIEPSDSSTCSKAVQSDNVLSLSFVSYECKTLEVNDYIDFCGERFWATDRYTPKQNSSVEWEYNVKLYGIESLIKRYLVVKLVGGDNETEFSYTATAYDQVTLIVQNINAGMETSDWKVGEVVTSEYLVIDYEGTYCDEGLKKVADLTGVEYWIEGTTVNVSRCEHSERITLGYNNGLTFLYSDKSDNVKFFTRLFPIGSTRNIAYDTYGHSRLQLPNGIKYLDQDVEKFGVVHHYEKEAFAHIYPRRIGKVSSVRSEVVKGEDGKPFTIYYFKDDSLNFNPNDYEMNGLVKMVSFQDNSSLSGRDFEVNYNAKAKEFEIITQWPYNNDIQLPNEQLSPKRLDDYILWNIKMPIEYYALAEAEYKKAVEKFMAEQYNDVSVYKAHTDYINIAERGLNLTIGQRVRLEHAQYFSEGYRNSRITKITRKVVRPTEMDIEISDVLSKGALEKVDDNIAKINQYTQTAVGNFPDLIRSWESTMPTDTTVFSSKATSNEYLSKRRGGDVLQSVRFHEGNQSDTFTPGIVGGEGYAITKRGGKWYIEIDGVTIREYLEVPEIKYNRITATGNEFWATDAGVVDFVEKIDQDIYRITLKSKEDEVTINFELKDILRGVWRNDTGFAVAFFEVVATQGTTQFDCVSLNGIAPERFMTLARQGNKTNADRRGSVYIDGLHKYLRVLDGVTDDRISLKNIKVQLGDLSGIMHPTFGKLSGYGALMENAYISGKIVLKDDQTGDEWAMGAVAITGDQVFHYDTMGYVDTPIIVLTAEERGFTSSERVWQYKSGGDWCEIEGECAPTIGIRHDAPYWGDRSVISIRYMASRAYYDIITLSKVYDGVKGDTGEAALSMQGYTTPGYQFYREGQRYKATIWVEVFQGESTLTESIAPHLFVWERSSENPEGDQVWNAMHKGAGNIISITEADLAGDTSIICSLLDNNNIILKQIKF